MDIVTLDPDGTVRTAADGDRVALTTPPQGGRIVLAGARARNVCADRIQVKAALTDLCTGRVVGLESRTVVYRAVGDGGVAEVGEPGQISSYANIGVCPNVLAARNLDEEPYRLTVTIEDKIGRLAAKIIQVTPTCAEPDRAEDCRCLCAEGYVLGESCAGFPDAGPPVSCPADAGVP